MWIILDTTAHGSARFYYSTGESWTESSFAIAESLDVLTKLEAVLDASNTAITQLRGVGFIQGKGGFTSTRIAATIANTLGYSLHVPVIGLLEKPTQKPVELFARAVMGGLVLPAYSAPASIGGKK